MRWGWGIAVVAVVIGLAAPARGDGAADKAAAAKLFKQGRDDISAGRVDEACEKFEQSFKLDPAIGTKLNLADCLERQGLLTAAYRLFDEAAIDAAKGNKEGRENYARQRAIALVKRMVKVELEIAEPDTDGLSVTVAGVVVAKGAWDEPRLLAPGSIDIDVTAPGRTAFHTTLDGHAGEVRKVDVPALAAAEEPKDPEPNPAIKQPPEVAPKIVPPTEPPVGEVRRDGKPSRALAYVVGATGVALVGGSVALGFTARSKFRNAECGPEAGLPEHSCTPDGQDTTNSARRLADIGTGMAIAGAVAVGIGVYLFVRARPHHKDHVVVSPVVSDDGVGVVLTVSR